MAACHFAHGDKGDRHIDRYSRLLTIIGYNDIYILSIIPINAMTSPISTPTQAGLVLATRRKALKLSQRDLASRLGISQARLSELETDPSRITLDRLISLAGALGLELVLRDRPTSSSNAEW